MLIVNYKSITFGFKNGKEVKITNVNGIHEDEFNNNRKTAVYFYGVGRHIQIFLDEVRYIICEY